MGGSCCSSFFCSCSFDGVKTKLTPRLKTKPGVWQNILQTSLEQKNYKSLHAYTWKKWTKMKTDKLLDTFKTKWSFAPKKQENVGRRKIGFIFHPLLSLTWLCNKPSLTLLSYQMISIVLLLFFPLNIWRKITERLSVIDISSGGDISGFKDYKLGEYLVREGSINIQRLGLYAHFLSFQSGPASPPKKK